MRNIFTQKLYKLSITQLCLNQLESGMKSQMKYISSNYAICTLCYSVCHMAFYDYDIQQLLFIPLTTQSLLLAGNEIQQTHSIKLNVIPLYKSILHNSQDVSSHPKNKKTKQ
jgi:hypothetical protein